MKEKKINHFYISTILSECDRYLDKVSTDGEIDSNQHPEIFY